MNIKNNIGISLLLILLTLFISCKNKNDGFLNTDEEKGEFEADVDTLSVKRIDSILAPDTAINKSNFYYDLHRMEIDNNRNIILADNSMRCIRIYNPSNDQFELTFGRKGSGPGEFQFINELIYKDGVGIITIDNLLRRATIFNSEGSVIKEIKLMQMTDDIQIIQDSLLILSSYELVADFKTIQIVSMNTEKLKVSFGPFIEPQKNILVNLKNLNQRVYLRNDYSFMSLTGILYLKENNSLIFSQKHPYSLWIIDLNNTNSTTRFNKNVPFSTFSNNTIEIKDHILSKTLKKSGIQLHPRIVKNRIVAAIFNENDKINFLDIYSLDGNFIKRLKIPALEDKFWLQDFAIDDKNNIMYLLVKDNDKVSWIERFKIDPKVFN